MNVTKIKDSLGIYNDIVASPIEIQWSALKTLRDGGTLTPGAWYRITDYTCNATDIDIFVADANLDILVCADDASHLNENARAAHHSGDTYYNNSKLEAWELKYTIDSDASNPKGVVYWVKDENGREYGVSYVNEELDNIKNALVLFTEQYIETGNWQDVLIWNSTLTYPVGHRYNQSVVDTVYGLFGFNDGMIYTDDVNYPA